MKINEIVTEAKEGLRKGITQPISNLTTYPDMNMSTGAGGAYMNYRFGVACAGSPDITTPAESPIGGDPMTVTYTDAEAEILNAAAAMVGCRPGINHSKGGSEELKSIQKVSPVAKPKKNKYGV
jgi:hypothetical protein